MLKKEIALNFTNATAKVVGSKHGITEKQLDRQLNLLPDKIQKLRATQDIRKREKAYKDLVKDEGHIRQVKKIIAQKKGLWENLVILGIGGSALGNIALQTALNPYMYNIHKKQRSGPRLFVFDNIDPPQFVSFLKWADNELDRTMFNVISRSGTAAETMSQLMIIREILQKRGTQHFRKQVVVTTCYDHNPLHKIALEEGLERLEIPKYVGGRFSVLSPVGLFSADMCKIKVKLLIEGAQDMRRRCQRISRNNPAAIIAAIHHSLYQKGKRISVMMPYSYALKDMADWYRQLWAESLGKAEGLDGETAPVGPTPVRALGATDQHSQLQLYLDGLDDKVFTFMQVEKFKEDRMIGKIPHYTPELKYLENRKLSTLYKIEKKATETALLNKKRPCLSIIFPEVNPYTVGQFIYLYETVTFYGGAFFGINPFDQPGVGAIRDMIPPFMAQSNSKRSKRKPKFNSN